MLVGSSLLDLLEVKADRYRTDADPAERRVRPRRRCCRIVLMRPNSASEDDFRLTSTWDISEEGIGLMVDRPLEAGTILEVRFRHISVADREARVIYSMWVCGGWHVGCLLDRPFDYAECEALDL
jgi:hypothetical protein